MAILAAVALQGCTGEPIEDESLLAAEAARQIGAKTVVDWHLYSETALAGVAGQPPWVSTFGFAMVQGAVYDAVNAIERTHQPYLVAPRAMPWYSKDAAAATAAYRVLENLVPDQQSSLKQLYDKSLAAISNGPAKLGGIGVGAQAAAAMIAARRNDGRDRTLSWAANTAPGQWRPTPSSFADAAAFVGFVKPFTTPGAEVFRSQGPLSLTSEAYAREFQEVQEIGSISSTIRTPDQTDAARYWHEEPWGEIFRSIAVSQRLSTAKAARMFAMISIVRADAISACFNDKYFWNFWRPVTAVRDAALDGNPATHADSAWTPLIDTPPFPDHPSGHSCGSGAATKVLRDFFGTDKMAFGAFAPRTGVTRNFTGFSQVLAEIVEARIWGGIHFRTADVQGVTLGEKVAEFMQSHFFQPLR